MDYPYFIIGFVLGFIFAYLLSGKKSGEKGILGSLKFNFKNYKIHIHHWIISLAILIILIAFKYYNYFIYGILIGIFVQGLTYKDFYKIIYKNKK
ncbi:MAG: hypothetical protein WC812_03150 [Candidatus Pacearchaeota archaeon]|jgi:hypothetical protein